jgi:hypothetical protein
MPDSSSPLLSFAPLLLVVFAAPVSALAARVQRGSEHNAWEGACEARERCQDWASLTRDLEPSWSTSGASSNPLPMEGRNGKTA